jgi:uncharacterized protein YjlB
MVNTKMHETQIETHLLHSDGTIPNNPKLPLLVYPGALAGESMNAVRNRILSNKWEGAWVGSVYDFHHYHSRAHEVLGCFQGSAKVQFGGESGPIVEIQAGDGVVIPAGVGHKSISASSDFAVIGAYPAGQNVDMCKEMEDTMDLILSRIENLPLPQSDPFFGKSGPLLNRWR